MRARWLVVVGVATCLAGLGVWRASAETISPNKDLVMAQKGLAGMFFGNVEPDGKWSDLAKKTFEVFVKDCQIDDKVSATNTALFKKVSAMVAEIQVAVSAGKDGEYGEQTLAKVKAYQKATVKDPKPDGYAGTRTRAYLLEKGKLKNGCLGTLTVAQAKTKEQAKPRVDELAADPAPDPDAGEKKCVAFSQAEATAKGYEFKPLEKTVTAETGAAKVGAAKVVGGWYCLTGPDDEGRYAAEFGDLKVTWTGACTQRLVATFEYWKDGKFIVQPKWWQIELIKCPTSGQAAELKEKKISNTRGLYPEFVT